MERTPQVLHAISTAKQVRVPLFHELILESRPECREPLDGVSVIPWHGHELLSPRCALDGSLRTPPVVRMVRHARATPSRVEPIRYPPSGEVGSYCCEAMTRPEHARTRHGARARDPSVSSSDATYRTFWANHPARAWG